MQTKSALTKNQDQLITNPALIPGVAVDFYTNLFSAPTTHNTDPFEHQVRTFIEDLPTPTLQPILNKLDCDISSDKIAHALREPLNSVPQAQIS